MTPWTIARQSPLSVQFSKQEDWSELPFPSPGDLPDPGVKPKSPALQADSLPTEPPGGSRSQSACLFPLSGWPQDHFRPYVALKHHRLKLTPDRAVPPGSLAPKAVLALLLYCKCSKETLPEPLICNYLGISRESPALLPPIHSQFRRLSPILYSWGGI